MAKSKKGIDKITKSALENKSKRVINGLRLYMDKNLLESDLSASAKNVAAALFADIPKKIREKDIKVHQYFRHYDFYHKHHKSKKELIDQIGISETQYYRAINELEEKGWVTSVTGPNDKGIIVTMYQLNYTIDTTTPGYITITSDILNTNLIKTKSKKGTKTLSPNSKIVMAKFAGIARQRKSHQMKIETTVAELNKEVDIPKSTLYYLIKRFMLLNLLDKKQMGDCVILIELFNEYTQLAKKALDESPGGISVPTSVMVSERKVIPDTADDLAIREIWGQMDHK